MRDRKLTDVPAPGKISFQDWGLIAYKQAWQKQEALFKKALASKEGTSQINIPQTIIFCEHPHVFTLGRNGSAANLLLNENQLLQKRIDFFKTDRGGDITYHGYGQLMTYFILDLEAFGIGLRNFIYLIEEAVIDCLLQFGISSSRLEKAAGVWYNAQEKICALGIKASRHLTMHGLALNVNPDLHFFNYINACGFQDKKSTSMEKILAGPQSLFKVKEKLQASLLKIFSDRSLEPKRSEPISAR